MSTYGPLWYQSLGYSTLRDRRADVAAELDPPVQPVRLGLARRPHRPARAAAAPRRRRLAARLGRLLRAGRLHLGRCRHRRPLRLHRRRDSDQRGGARAPRQQRRQPRRRRATAGSACGDRSASSAPSRRAASCSRPSASAASRSSSAACSRSCSAPLATAAVDRAAACAVGRDGALSVLRQPVVAWFFAGVFLTVLAHTSLYAFYSLYLASLGYGNGEIGLLWAIGVVVEVVWFYFQGRWLHRLSMHGWLIVAALASALRFALIAAFGGLGRRARRRPVLHALTLRGPALGVHRRHHAPLPGAPARPRPGALHRARLRRVGRDRRRRRRRAQRDAWASTSVFWAASVVALAAAWCCRRALHSERATP